MPIKKGTIKHKYTEQDFINISKGIFIEGVNKRSQIYAYERYLKSKDVPKRIKPRIVENVKFTPEEDLCVIDDEVISTKSPEDCAKRKAYLMKNFVDVGWGNLIGTKVIHW